MSKDKQSQPKEVVVVVQESKPVGQRSQDQEIRSVFFEIQDYMKPVTSHYCLLQKSYLAQEKKVIDYYDTIPLKLTKLKRDIVLPLGNENKRMIILGLSSLTSVLLVRRFVSGGALTLTRNAFFSYFGLGLFLVPEIYNPYLINKQLEVKFNAHQHNLHHHYDKPCFVGVIPIETLL